MDSIEWIRESNLIEGINSLEEDMRSFKAWKWFTKQDLTVASILELHRKIMLKQLRPAWRGKLRRLNVTVGGRECPHYMNVPLLFQGWLENWAHPYLMMRHKTDSIEDLIKEAHINFEHIHPFVDGNGRTGRMILNWQRNWAGLEPLLIKYSLRWSYYEWFK